MKNLSPRSKNIILVAAVLAVAAIGYWLYARQTALSATSLSASGSVEAVEVQIAPEISGKVVEILVDEGDSFQAGAPLFRIDDSSLKSQRQQNAAALQIAKDNLTAAEAGLEAAKAAYQTAQANAEVAKANNQADLITAQKALQDLYDNAASGKAATATALATANRAVRDAQYQLDNFSVPTEQQGLAALEALAKMKERLDQARAAFEPYKFEASGNKTREDLKDALDEAQSAYDTAVRRMELETALDKANAQQQKATQDLEAVQKGPRAEDVSALKARVTAVEAMPKQVDAMVAQAFTGIAQAQAKLDQTRSSVDQAQAVLDTIDLQLQKTVVYAPSSGVLLARGIEVGEVVQAGATVMSAGLLENVNITVYVPEDRYGTIKLGQKATVTVDSFPGQTFEAVVTNISDKAEFTPRNVQTVEGRKTTVYAVKLSIPNPNLDLKVGMPADVSFGQ